MKSWAMAAGTAATLAAAPATAEGIVLKPLAEARFRYEHVDQDGLAKKADAVTVRLRGGVEAKRGGLSALIEAQGNLALVGRYYDGLHGVADRPLVPDPENVALYRAQVRYERPGLAVTAGRQRIALDDERFVGGIPFRNNGQSFDAVRLEWSPMKALHADVSYAWSIRTIWGVEGRGFRQQAVSGNTVLAEVGLKTRLGTVAGLLYLIDEDEAPVQGFRLESQSYGARFTGTQALSPKTKLSYLARYLRQSDWHRNPNDYVAHFYGVEATVDHQPVKVTGGYEVLGANRGVAFTSFQTPLAAIFRHLGWADKFLTTPPDGLRRAYASAGYTVKTRGPLGPVNLQAVYHRFDSDRLVRRYGDEIDLFASAKIRRTTVSLRYADYRAKTFATDTKKVWLQADWAL